MAKKKTAPALTHEENESFDAETTARIQRSLQALAGRRGYPELQARQLAKQSPAVQREHAAHREYAAQREHLDSQIRRLAEQAGICAATDSRLTEKVQAYLYVKHAIAFREQASMTHEQLRAILEAVAATPPSPPQQVEPAAVIETTPPAPTESTRGVSPRRLWFLQQYEARGTDTYHKPAKIYAKWDGMMATQRAAICPDWPNRIAQDTVVSDIKRALEQRDGNKPEKPKRKPRKKA